MGQSLSEGVRFSRYTIVERLASGGMGEVYKALDDSLGRYIALKVLPPSLMGRDDRVRRFIQEAKAASSLSHPNIVTIHEIGQATLDGAGAEASPEVVHFIAMELVDGETLREKIHGERRDLRSLLRYLAQAADGLAKAHAAGIVHRDLKPDNIMVTRDGFAKVLDFGLAKLVERGDPHSESVATAVKEHHTREGTVLGTVGYMAPEQVSGKAVDARADIFSFGCILYEAICGERPFRGESDVDVMHKILHDEPRSISEVSPSAPVELKRIVRRCLAKNPDERYQSMKDLALELRDLADEFPSLTPSSPSLAAQQTHAHVSLWRSPLLWIAVIVVALTGAAGSFLLLRHRGVTPLSEMKITRLTSHGKSQVAAISGDGRYIAYSIFELGKSSLILKQIATGSEISLIPPTDTEFINEFSFSPDGNYLYVTIGRMGAPIKTLYSIPALGGPRRAIVSDVDSRPVCSPDGKSIAFVRRKLADTFLLTVPAEGGAERVVAKRTSPEEFGLAAPAWSPDGTLIALPAISYQGGLGVTILVMRPDGTEQKELVHPRWFFIGDLAWLQDGGGIAAVASKTSGARQLWKFLYPSGEAQHITNDLIHYRSLTITADGKTLVTVQSEYRRRLWKYRGTSETALTNEGDSFNPNRLDVAPDGSLIYGSFAEGTGDIWRMMPGGELRRLTTDPRDDYYPALSADGTHIFFDTERNGSVEIWSMTLDGADQRPVAKLSEDVAVSPSPDGRWLIYGTQKGIWRLPAAGGLPQKIADYISDEPRYSPDGKWIAGYMSPLPSPGGQIAVLSILPADGGGAARPIAPAGLGWYARWTADGKAVATDRRNNGIDDIWLYPIAGSPATQLTHFDAEYPFIDQLFFSRDGKDFYVSRQKRLEDVVMISDFQ